MSTQHINSYPVPVEDNPYCSAVEAIDQGLCSEMVFVTNNYTQVENDPYCSAVEAIDEGLHAELVYNYV